jgi:hypothetical protein
MRGASRTVTLLSQGYVNWVEALQRGGFALRPIRWFDRAEDLHASDRSLDEPQGRMIDFLRGVLSKSRWSPSHSVVGSTTGLVIVAPVQFRDEHGTAGRTGKGVED